MGKVSEQAVRGRIKLVPSPKVFFGPKNTSGARKQIICFVKKSSQEEGAKFPGFLPGVLAKKFPRHSWYGRGRDEILILGERRMYASIRIYTQGTQEEET